MNKRNPRGVVRTNVLLTMSRKGISLYVLKNDKAFIAMSLKVGVTRKGKYVHGATIFITVMCWTSGMIEMSI